MIGNEVVAIGAGVTLDASNNPVPGTAPVPVAGCVVEPMGSSELTVRGRTGTYTQIRVYLPANAPVSATATSVLAARGHDWMVVGEPDEWIDEDEDLSGQVVVAARGRG
ncbi:hypothetical protein [Nocardia sp. CA-290969]|uniref:hypothetical protein n=1 Tax=Nocardia sp. CA-290969 TaxID=3239986 RepID=UPI003D8C5439